MKVKKPFKRPEDEPQAEPAGTVENNTVEPSPVPVEEFIVPEYGVSMEEISRRQRPIPLT
jgi:hypothetical protein